VVGPKIDWGAGALARFCAPWVSDAGEKEKNGLPREREAFALRRFGPKSRGRVPAKAFFSFSPGNCLGCKKRARAHAPRSASSSGFLIDVVGVRRWGSGAGGLGFGRGGGPAHSVLALALALVEGLVGLLDEFLGCGGIVWEDGHAEGEGDGA